jgi:hypothetical protein
MSRGKGEDWREKFASDMAALWPIFEAATPADWRGYVYGDILFHPGKSYARVQMVESHLLPIKPLIQCWSTATQVEHWPRPK